MMSKFWHLIYAVRHFIDVPLKFKTAVLVDRNHKKYPWLTKEFLSTHCTNMFK
jgi:hypothetical protein